jgi:hypothetical protein
MKVVVVIAALAYFVELIRTTVRNGNPSMSLSPIFMQTENWVIVKKLPAVVESQSMVVGEGI